MKFTGKNGGRGGKAEFTGGWSWLLRKLMKGGERICEMVEMIVLERKDSCRARFHWPVMRKGDGESGGTAEITGEWSWLLRKLITYLL